MDMKNRWVYRKIDKWIDKYFLWQIDEQKITFLQGLGLTSNEALNCRLCAAVRIVLDTQIDKQIDRQIDR